MTMIDNCASIIKLTLTLITLVALYAIHAAHNTACNVWLTASHPRCRASIGSMQPKSIEFTKLKALSFCT
jgi:hypothetical protein